METSKFSDELLSIVAIAFAVRAVAAHLARLVPEALRVYDGETFSYRWGRVGRLLSGAASCPSCCTFWLAWPAALLIAGTWWTYPLSVLAINGAALFGSPAAQSAPPTFRGQPTPSKPPCAKPGGGCGG